jgi:hypothetical protein
MAASSLLILAIAVTCAVLRLVLRRQVRDLK